MTVDNIIVTREIMIMKEAFRDMGIKVEILYCYDDEGDLVSFTVKIVDYFD